VLQTASMYGRPPIQGRCTRWTRETGNDPLEFCERRHRYSMGHRSWTAPSIGDRATEISKEPENNKVFAFSLAGDHGEHSDNHRWAPKLTASPIIAYITI